MTIRNDLATQGALVLLAALCCAALCGCSNQRAESHALDTVRTEWAVDIYVDVKSAVLGAYAVELQFDATVFHVTTVTGGSATAFSGVPKSLNPASYASGKVLIADFQTEENAPSGKVHVCTVHFKAVGRGTSPLSLALTACSDPLGNKIIATAHCAPEQLIMP